MSWSAIQASVAVGPAERGTLTPAAGGAPELTSSFARLVEGGIAKVNGQLVASQVDLQRLAAGDVQNLHQIMMRLEESRLSFQLLMQVRNRLLEAYQEVMRMQV